MNFRNTLRFRPAPAGAAGCSAANCRAREPLLRLFTTLENPAAEAAGIYGFRWNVETDLRALKRTGQLRHIQARSVELTGKELPIASMAYNLVRTVMCLAARKAGLRPRQLSFTCVDCRIETHLPSRLGAGYRFPSKTHAHN